MKISSLLSHHSWFAFLGERGLMGPHETFPYTLRALVHFAAAARGVDVTAAPEHEALIEMAARTAFSNWPATATATSRPCRYPQSPRPVGQTNNKKKVLMPVASV